MLPTLEPDDEVLIAPRREARVGDVVVARHPFRSDAVLIKRLDAYDERGNAVLLGDNPTESTDSRTLGAVPPDRILGPVTSRF
jgi:nickel-type superoxide dismutase maturation protease